MSSRVVMMVPGLVLVRVSPRERPKVLTRRLQVVTASPQPERNDSGSSRRREKNKKTAADSLKLLLREFWALSWVMGGLKMTTGASRMLGLGVGGHWNWTLEKRFVGQSIFSLFTARESRV